MKQFISFLLLAFTSQALSEPKSFDISARELLQQLEQEGHWTERQVQILNALLLEKIRLVENGFPDDIAALLDVATSLTKEVDALTRRLHSTQQAQIGLMNPIRKVPYETNQLRRILPRLQNALSILRARADELSSEQQNKVELLSQYEAAAVASLRDAGQ